MNILRWNTTLYLLIVMVVTPSLSADDRGLANSAEANWDQAKVLSLSQDLVKVFEAIQNDKSLKNKQITIIQQRKFDAALLDFEFLREATDKLVSQLKAGKDYRYTRPAFKRVHDLREKVRNYSRDTEIAQSVRLKANDASKLMEQLKILYNI